MRRRKNFTLILVLLLLLSGCSGSQARVPDYAPGEENQLIVYTSHKEEVYLPIIREFESRTGIWVQVVTGGTNELLEQLSQQSCEADVMFGGGVDTLEYYRRCFTPYTCADSELLQSQYKSADSIWTPFSALPVVLIYNTKLVSPGELTGWADLLSPAFGGRIAFADPAVSGSSFTALLTQILASGLESKAAMTQLAQALQGNILESSGDVLTAVADGTCLVGVTLEETALKYTAAGKDIAIVYPDDGTTCVPDGIALVKDAPHMDNAKCFLDFVISYDVQQLLPDSLCRRSVRTDVSGGDTLPDMQTIATLDYDISWACRNRDLILSDWAWLKEEALP